MSKMEANELRMGNLILYKGEVIPVTMIGEYGIQSKYHGNIINAKFATPDLEPIPLTEEWLLKLGFEKEPDYDDVYGDLFEIDWFGGFFLKEGRLIPKPYYFANAFSESLEIRYVHQLQNLFFALTGEEIKIEK